MRSRTTKHFFALLCALVLTFCVGGAAAFAHNYSQDDLDVLEKIQTDNQPDSDIFEGINFSDPENQDWVGAGVAWMDIDGSMRVTELRIWGRNLTNLDVSGLSSLTRLYCDSNNLTTLDVSNNMALARLNCSSNNLTTLDVSNNTALVDLYCSSNNLSVLDVSKNAALEWFYCSSNNLSMLDVSKNTELWVLDCSSNNLSVLDVSKNTELWVLDCSSNNLSVLDVSKNTELWYFYCSSNNLSTLDVSKNTELWELDCSSNPLSALNIGGLKDITYGVSATVLPGTSLLLVSNFDDWVSDIPLAVSVDITPDGALLTGLHGGVQASVSSESSYNAINIYTSEWALGAASVLGQTVVWDEPAASGTMNDPIRGTLKLPVDATMIYISDIVIENSVVDVIGTDWDDMGNIIALDYGANELLFWTESSTTSGWRHYAITVNRATVHDSGAIDTDADNWSLSTNEMDGETRFSLLIPTAIPASMLDQAVFAEAQGLYIDGVTGAFEVHGDTLRLRLRGIVTDIEKAEITGITYAVGSDLYRQSMSVPFTDMSGNARGSSGSSGCNAAPGALLLLPAIAAIAQRRRRRG